MNKNQWETFGYGLLILSIYFNFSSGTLSLREHFYYNMFLSDLAIILFVVGLLFIICGFLEKKNKLN